MGAARTITSAIDESIPKSNDDVKVYYLNITNPADEQTGYKALRKYQGQNGAGIKASWLTMPYLQTSPIFGTRKIQTLLKHWQVMKRKSIIML